MVLGPEASIISGNYDEITLPLDCDDAISAYYLGKSLPRIIVDLKPGKSFRSKALKLSTGSVDDVVTGFKVVGSRVEVEREQGFFEECLLSRLKRLVGWSWMGRIDNWPTAEVFYAPVGM